MKKYFFLVMFIISSNFVHSASFDCEKAKTIVEKKICSSQEISGLDDQLNILFNIALMSNSDEKLVRSQQREWLTQKRNSCNDDSQLKFCLIKIYRNRIVEINENIEEIILSNEVEYHITNKKHESCSPNGKQKAHAYRDPAVTNDKFDAPDGIGLSWSFSVQANVKIGDKKYKIGKLISPRGGEMDLYYYIDPLAWDCANYYSD